MSKTEFVGVRVTPDISSLLDKVAAKYGISRSSLIRDLLENCDYLYGVFQVERERSRKDRKSKEKKLLSAIQDKLPNNLTPVMAEMMGEMMKRVMYDVAKQLSAKMDADKKEGGI